MEIIQLPELAAYRDRARRDALISLRVVAVLRRNAPVCAYDLPQLDNLLARAVVNEATQGRGVPNSEAPYDLPTPLQCLWRSPEGLPLWAASCFTPVGRAEADTVYWHKRAPTGRFAANNGRRLSLTTKSGRWMERRVPVPVTVAGAWEAFCVGEPSEIARLLAGISHLGKKRAIGWGEVREWRIEPEAEPFALVREGRLVRPLPEAARTALLPDWEPQEPPYPLGWTPPQWKHSLFAFGWPVGTRVTG